MSIQKASRHLWANRYLLLLEKSLKDNNKMPFYHMFATLFFHSAHTINRLLGMLANITYNHLDCNYHPGIFKISSFDKYLFKKTKGL